MSDDGFWWVALLAGAAWGSALSGCLGVDMFGNELSCYRLEKELMLHEMKRIKRQVKPEKEEGKALQFAAGVFWSDFSSHQHLEKAVGRRPITKREKKDRTNRQCK
jgi:hypothetical protein